MHTRQHSEQRLTCLVEVHSWHKKTKTGSNTLFITSASRAHNLGAQGISPRRRLDTIDMQTQSLRGTYDTTMWDVASLPWTITATATALTSADKTSTGKCLLLYGKLPAIMPLCLPTITTQYSGTILAYEISTTCKRALTDGAAHNR